MARVFLDDAPETQPAGIADDMLIGAAAIARFLRGGDSRESLKWVYRAGELKLFPIGKFGGSLIASKKALKAAYQRLTGAAE